ncbi:MAG: type II toxin-antitoxin system RelE/ParE family toxin [Rhodocyclaceae bacterium]|nr:type II toxin-antitoxin system RelE/ParE family toxin [Rhodocyclaceae bacterium]
MIHEGTPRLSRCPTRRRSGCGRHLRARAPRPEAPLWTRRPGAHLLALADERRSRSNGQSGFKKKLAERLEHPRVPSAKLSGHPNRYKIKLASAGYRLVYEVRETEAVVVVIAVGKRERNLVYTLAAKR